MRLGLEIRRRAHRNFLRAIRNQLIKEISMIYSLLKLQNDDVRLCVRKHDVRQLNKEVIALRVNTNIITVKCRFANNFVREV